MLRKFLVEIARHPVRPGKGALKYLKKREKNLTKGIQIGVSSISKGEEHLGKKSPCDVKKKRKLCGKRGRR